MASNYFRFSFQTIVFSIILVCNTAGILSDLENNPLNAVCHYISSTIFSNITIEEFEIQYSCDEEKSTTGKFRCNQVLRSSDKYCCTECGDDTLLSESGINQDYVCNECYSLKSLKSSKIFMYQGRQIANDIQRQQLRKMWQSRREKWEKANEIQQQQLAQKYKPGAKSGTVSSSSSSSSCKQMDQIINQVLVFCVLFMYIVVRL